MENPTKKLEEAIQRWKKIKESMKKVKKAKT